MFYFLSGIMYFDGPTVPRETYRWNHVCSSVSYSSEGAHRIVVSDRDILFNFTSDYFENSKWPLGHNFTFGGRTTLVSSRSAHFPTPPLPALPGTFYHSVVADTNKQNYS